ncbi:MAG: AraC family transcriptional regulator [Tannerella sp.]|jgi:AraC-like DNA-binding protein|nr:AraC family transcriptional regulator [Tannerella sp.]
MKNEQLRYLAVHAVDEAWGTVVTTVGYQFIPPDGAYPLSRHPEKYHFSPLDGRTLNEYQLIYITRGTGYFASASVGQQKIGAGTMCLLFPDEWHSYSPDPDTGWHEYWVGFRSRHIDQRIGHCFFTKEEPLFRIGSSATLVHLYEDILTLAEQGKTGYQQMISGIVHHIMGMVYYKHKNRPLTDSPVEDKIFEARRLIRDNIEGVLSQEEIAARLGLGYSWFRRMFREYTGVSPAQYQLQQKLLRAKELLADTAMNISEVAYALHFENPGQFSTFFKNRAGLTPSRFREEMRRQLFHASSEQQQ